MEWYILILPGSKPYNQRAERKIYERAKIPLVTDQHIILRVWVEKYWTFITEIIKAYHPKANYFNQPSNKKIDGLLKQNTWKSFGEMKSQKIPTYVEDYLQ